MNLQRKLESIDPLMIFVRLGFLLIYLFIYFESCSFPSNIKECHFMPVPQLELSVKGDRTYLWLQQIYFLFSTYVCISFLGSLKDTRYKVIYFHVLCALEMHVQWYPKLFFDLGGYKCGEIS